MHFTSYKHWLNETQESYIIDMMKHIADMLKGSGKQGEFYKWKLDNAKLLTHVKTDEISKQYPQIAKYLKKNKTRVVQKQCYKNAAQLAMECDGVMYVEGEISYHRVPIEHAWNKIDDKYFDITKDILFSTNSDYAEYVKIIELDVMELLSFMNETGTYGGFLIEKFKKDTGL